jgi:hypothetical protein
MSPTPSLLSRRAALARLGIITAGLAAGCTPVRFALRAYPQAFDNDEDVRERVLRAFVRVVVPGADPADANLTRAFSDRFFPFRKYRNFFAADLCRRSDRRFRESEFSRLDRREQAAVVREGLGADAVTRRLYTGAVFLAQVSMLGGTYAEAAAIPALGFDGAYQFRGLEAVTYPEPGRFLARSTTPDGNPS